MRMHQILEASDPALQRFIDTMLSAHDDLVEFDLYNDQQGNIELNRIQVKPGQRSQGVGDAVMRELINFADKNQKLIWLSTADKNAEMGTTSRNRLVKFYRRYGFRPNKGRYKRFDLSMYASMYRDPK